MDALPTTASDASPHVATAPVSRSATLADLAAIEALHDHVFGPGALTRTAYRIREGMPALSPFCRVMFVGRTLVSAVRFTPIRIGSSIGALLLGPLAVASEHANKGYGRRLVAEGLAKAAQANVRLVLLVGDQPYYSRFGFRPVARGQIQMPGPIDVGRLLAAELTQGALSTFCGRVTGIGVA
jgi:predicted N-acetyltransferase YhbS